MSSSSRSHRAAAILDAIDDDLQLRYYSASDSESHLRDRGAEPEEDGYQPSYFSPTRFSDDAAYERRPTPIPESDAEDLAFDMDILHRLNESNQP